MAEVYQCRACGGNVIPDADGKAGVCAYCGKRMVFPRYGTRQMNLANQKRVRMEFEQAEALYQDLAMRYPDDPEIWWNILLCNYGIRYEQERDRRVITVNRMKYGSIYDEEAYKKAVSLADPQQRRIYEEEGRTIQAIQERLIEAARQEERYDIFISFKDKDSYGQRTQDSVLAQDIYDALEDAGYRVFYSRITLRTAIGEEFEPKIYAALQSARMMILVGTTTENIESIWVRNEWSRYLKLMETDAARFLLPVYTIGVRPEQLPSALSGIEGIQVNGEYLQTLLANVNRRFDRKADDAAQAGPASQAAIAHSAEELHWQQLQQTLERGWQLINEGQYQEGDACCETALDLEVECAIAWWGKLAAGTHGFDTEADYREDPDLVHCYEQAMMYATDEEAHQFRKDIAQYHRRRKRHICDRLYDQYSDMTEQGRRLFEEDQAGFERVVAAQNQCLQYAVGQHREHLEDEFKAYCGRREQAIRNNKDYDVMMKELSEIDEPCEQQRARVREAVVELDRSQRRPKDMVEEYPLHRLLIAAVIFLTISMVLRIMLGSSEGQVTLAAVGVICLALVVKRIWNRYSDYRHVMPGGFDRDITEMQARLEQERQRLDDCNAEQDDGYRYLVNKYYHIKERIPERCLEACYGESGVEAWD